MLEDLESKAMRALWGDTISPHCASPVELQTDGQNFLPYPPNLLFLLYSISESEIGHWFTLWTSESLSISLLSSWQKPVLISSPVTHLFLASSALNPCLWSVPTPGALSTLVPTKQFKSWCFPNQSSCHEELGIVLTWLSIRVRKFSFISNFKKSGIRIYCIADIQYLLASCHGKESEKVHTYVCLHMCVCICVYAYIL